MAHLGLVCPPVTGHLSPLAAVGRALAKRGHRVTLFHVPDVEDQARSEGLEFTPVGLQDFPLGALPQSVATLRSLSSRAALKYSVECACGISNAILRDGPGIIRHANVDLLLVDQNEPAGGSVAEHLGIPFVSVCTSLPLNREPLMPPPFMGWRFSRSPFARARNGIGYAIADRLIAPMQAVLNGYRQKWKLGKLYSPNCSFSQVCSIAQMPREFDFPRTQLSGTFHYLGPWFDSKTSSGIPFPFEKLDGRPIVYGSIGTLQDPSSKYFDVMAEACSTLDVQLVMSLGHGRGEATLQMAGNPLVMRYVPQLEILSRAAVVITHAGMNTTQQALYFGVPIVAIPLTHDQPAIAARLAHTGAGIVIRPSSLTSATLRSALISLLPAKCVWRVKSAEMQHAIRLSGGVDRAADLAETVMPLMSRKA